MQEHRLETLDAVQDFTLAGNAHLTLRSKATGTRFTYRVKRSKDGGVYFVSVLSGAENTSAYAYMGFMNARGQNFRWTDRSRVSREAKSFLAWEWFSMLVFTDQILPKTVEAWHEGRCGRCHRLLTVPESIERGIGPECSKYVAARAH